MVIAHLENGSLKPCVWTPAPMALYRWMTHILVFVSRHVVSVITMSSLIRLNALPAWIHRHQSIWVSVCPIVQQTPSISYRRIPISKIKWQRRKLMRKPMKKPMKNLRIGLERKKRVVDKGLIYFHWLNRGHVLSNVPMETWLDSTLNLDFIVGIAVYLWLRLRWESIVYLNCVRPEDLWISLF